MKLVLLRAQIQPGLKAPWSQEGPGTRGPAVCQEEGGRGRGSCGEDRVLTKEGGEPGRAGVE